MPLEQFVFDAGAQRLLRRYGPGQGLLITAVNNYGLPGETLTAERCSAALAERDPELVRLDTRGAVPAPVYAHRRVAAYARWRPLHVTAGGLGPWRYLAVAHEDEVWRDLLRWERAHPGQRARTSPPHAA